MVHDAGRDVGRRIVVYGPSGSGKTWLAGILGERLSLPVIELDALYHLPSWGVPTNEEFREKVSAALAAAPEGWVLDGNYSHVGDLALSDAETAIWLRLPFWVVFPRLVGRTLQRAWTGELVCGENRESFRKAFLQRDSVLHWGITNWGPHRRKTRARLRRARPGTRIVVLRTPSEVEAFVAELPVSSGIPDP